MRRVVFPVAFTVIGFLIGLGAFVLWRSSQTLPYCQVARNGERYHNKIIRVRATLIFGSDGVYVYEDCDPVEALASMVELDGTSGANGRNFVNQILVTSEKGEVRKAEVIIEGRFNAKFSKGCYGPKYHIAASKVELLGPLSDYSPPQVGDEGLRMKH